MSLRDFSFRDVSGNFFGVFFKGVFMDVKGRVYYVKCRSCRRVGFCSFSRVGVWMRWGDVAIRVILR